MTPCDPLRTVKDRSLKSVAPKVAKRDMSDDVRWPALEA